MKSDLLIGIDGGGTSTTCRLTDDQGTILGQASAGPSNIQAIGPSAAMTALDQSIALAFVDASLDRLPVDVACLGLAGFGRPADQQLLEAWSSELGWAERLVLVSDADLVIEAGTPEGWGVGVIAGTGSIVVGRSPDGRAARAGGWGYLIGDEGSAYAVALAGLRKVARRADGSEPIREGEEDHLSRMMFEALGIGGPDELVSKIYHPGFDRSKIASLAPVVVAAMNCDLSISEEILRPAGFSLMQQVLAVIRSLEFSTGILPVARAGSFLLNCPAISDVMKWHLSRNGYELSFNDVPEPVVGAVSLARKSLMS